MKMKRPSTWDITSSKSGWWGDTTFWPPKRTGFRRRSADQLWHLDISVARLYGEYDFQGRQLKKYWMLSSGLLVTIILSHRACVAASVKAFKRTGRSWLSPPLSSAYINDKDESMLGVARKVADEVKEDRILHQLWCQIWVTVKTAQPIQEGSWNLVVFVLKDWTRTRLNFTTPTYLLNLLGSSTQLAYCMWKSEHFMHYYRLPTCTRSGERKPHEDYRQFRSWTAQQAAICLATLLRNENWGWRQFFFFFVNLIYHAKT